MSDIKQLTKQVIAFRDERDWKQFNRSKDLAISLSLEASELLEHFQWKNDKEVEEYLKSHKKEISDELADVLIYLLTIGHDFNIDLTDAVERKLTINAKKYPIKKAKGNHLKYNKL
jgi:NTP pyrophosphatase (non-canonical NTP hydrolase)